MSNLLVVEDDDRIAAPLVRALSREGYTVQRSATGTPVPDMVRAGAVDLVLLDLGLPDMDGLDVCKELRDGGYQGGILILTARDDELDRVVGLDSGADDYLPKPFGLGELLARTRALLRRSAPAAARPVRTPAAGGLRLDRDAMRAFVDERELSLTPKEFGLLSLLMRSPGALVTRDEAVERVWDANWFGSTRMLDTAMGRLRQKLDDAGAQTTVVTLRGVGFRLEGADGGA